MSTLLSNDQALKENKQAYQQKVDQIQSAGYTDGTQREMIQEAKAEHGAKYNKLKDERRKLVKEREQELLDDAYSLNSSTKADNMAFDSAKVAYTQLSEDQLADAVDTISSLESAKALGKVLNHKSMADQEIKLAKRFPGLGNKLEKYYNFAREHGSKRSSKRKFEESMGVGTYKV